jgi:thiamine biosynthesis lipoprotein
MNVERSPAPLSRRDLLAFTRLRPDSGSAHWIRVHRAAMACRFEITLSGDDEPLVSAARAPLDEADRIEAALTVFRDTSELTRVNRTAGGAPAAVDADLFGLLHLCRRIHADTEGAFDITSTPLSRCWGFLKREGRVPAAAEIEAARARVGMDAVELHQDAEQRTVRFRRPGLELNLGSIGKGYALGKLGDLLRARGAAHALLSAGGSSVLALGGRGAGWCIDVKPRRLEGARLCRLYLRDGAMGTSGAGEQYVDVEGRRYGHVLDPRTGWPAAETLSVTVVTAEPALADALSTAFFVGGAELARRYCAAHPDTLAIVTPDDGGRRPQVFGRYAGAKLEGL